MPRFTEVEKRIIKKYVSNPDLVDSLALIRRAMESIWKTDVRIVRNYTDHGKEHSERIATFVEKLLQVNPEAKFSKEEIYLLLAGVYLHDIGMQCDVVKYPHIKKKAEDLGAIFNVEFTAETANSYSPEQQNGIRENHHLLSAAWIDYLYEGKDLLSPAIQSISDDLVDDLIDICKFHSKLSIQDCPDFFTHYPNNRKKMVAALLRFADELDISSSRVDLKTVQIFTIKPDNSVYWWLHNYTNISFIDFNKILVTVRLHPEDFKLYGSFVREDYITKFKNKNQPILDVLVGYKIPVVIDDKSDVTPHNRAKKFPAEITAVFDKKIQKRNLGEGFSNKTPKSKSELCGAIENYQKRKNDILSIAKEQKSILKNLDLDEILSKETKQGEIINRLIEMLQSDTFKILVLGRFSSGKSTFINALCGQAILPTVPTPTTGVICTIKYADDKDKKAVLYPKLGMGKNCDDSPYEVPISNIQAELKKYIQINNLGTFEETSLIKKIELYYPLALCKNGVEIIDSVGLDDPNSREDTIMQYIPSVDLIVYCMKSLDTYSVVDKATFNLLKSFKYESIFFVITYYDAIRESVIWGEMSSEDYFKNLQIKNLAPWTEFGEQGIMFVDLRSALLGKMKNDENLIESSGIHKVEKALESFIFQEKVNEKLLNALLTLKDTNRSARKAIQSRILMLQANIEELEEHYKNAELPLKNLEVQRQLMIQKVDSKIFDIARMAKDMTYSYSLELIPKIKKWSFEYEINSSIGFPPTKKKLEPVVSEVANYLKEMIEEDIISWSIITLTPMIRSYVEELKNSLEAKYRDFLLSIELARVEISVGDLLNSKEIIKLKKASTEERLLDAYSELLIQDRISGIGVFMGLKAILDTLILEEIAAILILIFAVFNPMSITTAIIADVLGSSLYRTQSFNDKIKKTIAEKYADEIGYHRIEICEHVESGLKEHLMDIKESLDSRLAGEISSIFHEVKVFFEERKNGRLNIESEMKKLRDLEQKNVLIISEIEEIIYEIKREGNSRVCS